MLRDFGAARPWPRPAISERPRPRLRYAYGATEPSFEEATASLAPVHTYRLEQPVTLRHGDHKFVQYARVDELPVTRFYVYDGVRFDRFQRHRRNDWNYGTESHSIVETHLQFDNEAPEGLGINLPPGQFRLYQRKATAPWNSSGKISCCRRRPASPGTSCWAGARSARGARAHGIRGDYAVARVRGNVPDLAWKTTRPRPWKSAWSNTSIAGTNSKSCGPTPNTRRPVSRPLSFVRPCGRAGAGPFIIRCATVGKP
jgi:hypothetical protein